MNAGIGLEECFFDFGLLADHFAVHDDGFNSPDAIDAPAGGHHFVDQVLFGRRGRLVSGGEFFLQVLEFILVFAFEEDGVARSEAVTQGVAGGFFLRFGGFGAAGFSSVGSGGVGPQL